MEQGDALEAGSQPGKDAAEGGAAPPPSHGQHREREHFFGAAKLIAGITALSRVAGLVRDMVVARYLGASRLTDAFNLAYMIPNLFRRLFGEGALSAAFVPVFSEILELRGRERAAALLANVLGLLGLLLAGLCVLTEVVLLVVHLLAPGAWDGQHILGFAAIMMPFMVSICLLAVGSAALNCVGHFAFPAAAPIILNVCTVAGAVAAVVWLPSSAEGTASPEQLTVVAIGVVAAGAVQLAMLVWLLKAHRLPFLPRLRPVEEGVGRMLKLMLPMLIPLGILQFNALLDKVVAWGFTATAAAPTLTVLGHTYAKPLQVGVVTWVTFGEHLYQFPLGVLALSLATAVFPLFSRYAARGETDNLRASINRALRLALFEGLPSGVGLLLLAEPLAALILEGKRYTAFDAAQTAHVVRFYGLGMWAFCMQPTLLRAYYAQKDTRTPLKVAVGLVGLNFLLNLCFIWAPGVRHGAFGLSTSITSAMNVVILTLILRRRLGRVGARRLIASGARIALATAAMAGAVLLAGWGLPRLGLRGHLPAVAGGVAAGVAAYFGTCRLLRAPEIGELLMRKQP